MKTGEDDEDAHILEGDTAEPKEEAPTITNPSPGRSRRSGILFNKRKYRPFVVSPLAREGANISSESDGESGLRIRLRVCRPNGKPFGEDTRYSKERGYQVNHIAPLNGTHEELQSKFDRSGSRLSRNEHNKVNGISEVYSETDSDFPLENPKSVESLDGPFDGNGGLPYNNEPVSRKRTYTSSSANSDSEGITRRPAVVGRRRGRRPSKKSFSDDCGNVDNVEGMQCGIYWTGPEDNHNEDLIDPKKHPTNFLPLDLVWAKCRGYPSYPAMVSLSDLVKCQCLCVLLSQTKVLDYFRYL